MWSPSLEIEQQPQNAKAETLPLGHWFTPHISDTELTSHGKLRNRLNQWASGRVSASAYSGCWFDLTIDRALIRWYNSGPEWTWGRLQWRGAPHSSKLQYHWKFTLRLFSVIYRTLLGLSYLSAELTLVYSTAPTDWVRLLSEYFLGNFIFKQLRAHLFVHSWFVSSIVIYCFNTPICFLAF